MLNDCTLLLQIHGIMEGCSTALQRQWRETEDMAHQLEDEKVDLEEKVMDVEEELEDKVHEMQIQTAAFKTSMHEVSCCLSDRLDFLTIQISTSYFALTFA